MLDFNTWIFRWHSSTPNIYSWKVWMDGRDFHSNAKEKGYCRCTPNSFLLSFPTSTKGEVLQPNSELRKRTLSMPCWAFLTDLFSGPLDFSPWAKNTTWTKEWMNKKNRQILTGKIYTKILPLFNLGAGNTWLLFICIIYNTSLIIV